MKTSCLDPKKTSVVPSPFRGLRILLVDSDTNSLQRISSILELHSYEVTTVELQSQALSLLQQSAKQFDLVLADVNMEETNCLKFMESIQLPIILMSSSTTNRELVKDAMSKGACFVLNKPIPEKQLMNVWQHVYRKRMCQTGENDSHRYKEEVVDNGGSEEHIKNGRKILLGLANDEAEGSKTKLETKSRLCWTPNLQRKFEEVICVIGEEARPKQVLELMKVPHLTHRQVSSHLQKYRDRVQRIEHSGATPSPIRPSHSSKELHNVNWTRDNDNTLTDVLQKIEEKKKQHFNINQTDEHLSNMTNKLPCPTNSRHNLDSISYPIQFDLTFTELLQEVGINNQIGFEGSSHSNKSETGLGELPGSNSPSFDMNQKK